MSSSMWVDKHKPTSSNDLIGQARNVSRIKTWLKTYDHVGSKPLFIYGPPGIGKTTAAHLCCKEVGYQVCEFNASDQRNKGIMKEIISTLSSNSRLNFFGRASDTKDAIILDEIDGMAGNEDRGGIAQLLIEIKHTKKPMIFICNDGQHQKLRSLKDKCETVEFKRPDLEAIHSVVTKIARKENLRMDKINLRNLADSTDYDIRQIINSLYMYRDGSLDQVDKSTRMSAFEAAKKALTYSNKLTMHDRFDCFFSDYNIMPLFIFENYAKNRPVKGDPLKAVSRAADSLCLGDLVDKEIRSHQTWSLLNLQALLSTVIPSTLMSSTSLGRIDFPQYLGKLSNTNKRLRLTQELNAHMSLKVRNGLDADYLEVMRERLSVPLINKDIESAVDFMYDYSLLRDDFNSIMELASWSFKPDPMTRVDSKTKTAFTLAYKKRSVMLPYFSDDIKAPKKRKQVASDDEEDYDEDEDEEAETEVIKPKRVIKNKVEPKLEKEKKKAKDKEVTEKSKIPKKENSTSDDVEKEKNKKKDKKQPLSKTVESEKKPDKRPIDGGISRFFTAKKQKSS